MRLNRITALLLAVMLTCGMLAACQSNNNSNSNAPATADETLFADDVSGVYVSDGLFLRVIKQADSSYEITAIKGTYNNPQIKWEMTGSVVNQTELSYTDCVKTDYTASDDGKKIYEDGKGDLTFSADSLTWNDEQEHIGEGITFMIR